LVAIFSQITETEDARPHAQLIMIDGFGLNFPPAGHRDSTPA
jgi:hypothetical protein